MFGGGRKKTADERPKKERGARNNMPLLMDVPGLDSYGGDMDDMLDEGDADLEKELADLVGGRGGGRQQRKKQKPQVEDLDSMVASCMKDYDSGEEFSDTDDPDLLAELQDLNQEEESPPPPPARQQPRAVEPLQQRSPQREEGVGHSLTETIQERLAVYREAEQVAKENGDTSRARRYIRGIKTLVELERNAKSGRPVREDDIPPQISVGKRNPGSSTDNTPDSEDTAPPAQQVPSPPPPALPVRHHAPEPAQTVYGIVNPQVAELQKARDHYKSNALAAKSQGDKETAMTFMKYIKVCDTLMEDARAGRTVDLSALQPEAADHPPPLERKFSRDTPVSMPENSESVPQSDPEQYGAPEAPATIAEALDQRLQKYKSEELSAKESGNGSKARRMGRISKQYEDAIKMHKAGRPIPRGDLPEPPGFGPIPVSDAPTQASHHPKPTAAAASASSAASANVASKTPEPPAAASAKGPSPPRHSSTMSVQDKQLAGLLKRQAMFKQAALTAKQQGQMDTAKEYLRQALSFNKLIEVSKGGIPVDMGTLPVPPQMQVKTNMDFEIVSKEECTMTGDREEMFSKLEQDIINQVKMCMTNRAYFKEVGDIASSNKFEQMALHSKKDLDAIRFAFKRGDPVPKFHYETRAFSRVVSNTDLTDNDLEVNILNGINYVVKNPKDVDTYINWEFPFPRDAPSHDKTAVIKDSNNPEYNSTFKIVINPRDKTFQRMVKRGAVKVEVWSKGGFLRSDTLIGTASVKIAPLETKCTIHDSYDLYDGRKPVGGKVEVKLRIRNGILAKQIEQAQEKWLVVQF
eukprot:GFUD01009812.1.p1 GENE.GFUD01009812.1~~GFUD01009812.1.p1  ORF type:complete len:808 (-),score=274.71 GFUD01009812.1:294-2717(-)